MFTTFESAKDWIESSIRFGDKLDLKRMTIASSKLHHPERQFKTIHIAGTNGKGSTTNFVKNILKQAGFQVGIYTSPYVVKFNERIGINDTYISDEDIIVYTNKIKNIWDEVYEEYQDSITFFEILTLMAFCYFADQHVDYAVIEVGLGGLLDATNIILPEVCAITNISWDHMKQLGNSLESIAMNKLGIVKPTIPLITTEANPALIPLFEQVCAQNHSEITWVSVEDATDIELQEETTFRYHGQHFRLHLTGFHQVKNACLAMEIVHCLQKKEKFSLNERMMYQGLYETSWPGRFEIFHHNIVLDGAHNIGGAESLKTTLQSLYKGKIIKGLFCMMKDKEHEKVIALFDDLFDEFHFTQIDYKRSATAEELCLESKHPKKFAHPDYKEAFELLRQLKDNEVLIITGSLYFISEIRQLLVS
jgi:dihydrofolate synthase / folylpolyglutamate synthase